MKTRRKVITIAIISSIMLIGIVVYFLVFGIQYETCYQESATVSNQYGKDGDCNLEYNGEYLITTYSSGKTVDYDYLYINYTKPLNSDGAIWKVKHGNFETYNISIPLSCWDAYPDKLSVRIGSNFGGGQTGRSQSSCYDGISWQEVGSFQVLSGGTGCRYSATGSEMYDGDWTTYASSVEEGTWYKICGAGSGEGGRIYEEAIWWNIRK